MKAFCSEYKCCEAQDGFELCIFCEDGVPCPNRQRAARPAITTTPAHITPLAPKKPGHPRNPNSPWRGNAGLYLGNNAPLKAAPTNSAVTLQEEASEPQAVDVAATTQEKLPAVEPAANVAGFDGWLAEKNRYREKRKQIKERTNMATKLCACGCGTELKPDSVWDYVKGHKTQPEKKKRQCGCGCGAPLVNRHPFIKGHNPDAKKSANGSAPASRSNPTPPPQFQFQNRSSGERRGHAARHGNAPQQLPFKAQPGREDRYRSAAS